MTRSERILYPLVCKCKDCQGLLCNSSHRSLEARVVKDSEWLAKDDEALEHLLVERWLYRGAMLAVMFISAIITTYLAVQEVTTLVDRLTAGALVAVGLAAAVVAFVMRLADIRIQKELRRRRQGRPGKR